MKTKIFMLSVLPAFFLTGCATIVKGSYQDIRVTSKPSGVWVKADPGQGGRAPCTLGLKKNKSIQLTAMYEGETQLVALARGVEGWFFGNIIFGGGIGMIIKLPIYLRTMSM